MAKNVRFIQTTKAKYLARESYDELALYFCIDTNELFKGSSVYTDGIRIVETKADLPECSCAADGVVYYIRETRNGYTLSPDRTEWLQTIYAPATDAYVVPESEIYNTVTTVGAVRDIERAIYTYVDEEIANIKVIGEPGKDGKDGKDGDSAYQVWLNAGHSGSEDDFLQWLKGDNEPFGNVVTSIGVDGIPAGTSLKGKTVKDVLGMLLGIIEASQSVVEHIVKNQIPAYDGTNNTGVVEVAYAELDVDTADYGDEGFYVVRDDTGSIINAGYQIAFEGNDDMDAQTFAIPSDAKIIGAYQYDEFGTQSWLPYEFPGGYWVAGNTINKIVNGQNVAYQTYYYDVDNVGDAITTFEYWRFEIEV